MLSSVRSRARNRPRLEVVVPDPHPTTQLPRGKITATDGPFTEAKEVIGGFALINAKDRAEAVEYAQRYADLFEEVEVEVRQVVEFDDLPAPA